MRLFHQSACQRQRRNMITSLSNGNSVATNQEEIASMVDGYYKDLIGAAPQRINSINLESL